MDRVYKDLWNVAKEGGDDKVEEVLSQNSVDVLVKTELMLELKNMENRKIADLMILRPGCYQVTNSRRDY